MANVEACLPANLQDRAVITPIAAGLSAAGVFRVEAAGRTYALKISSPDEPLAAWRRKAHIHQLAADASLAPRVIHMDESRRAVLSEFVVDRSFFAYYSDPRTHETALAQLGRTLRRVHELPVPQDAVAVDRRELLAAVWSELQANLSLPAFVGDAIRRAYWHKRRPPPNAGPS
jgi:aminoglycoside phosphotransferase